MSSSNVVKTINIKNTGEGKWTETIFCYAFWRWPLFFYQARNQGIHTNESAYDLGEMIVTGERTGVEDIAINTEITSVEIAATGSKTLAEALQYAPGVVVTYGAKNEPRSLFMVLNPKVAHSD